MDHKQLVNRIRRLHRLQAVTVVFAKTGIPALFNLRALMNNNQHVFLAQHQEVIMSAVMASGRWDRPQNQSFTIFGLAAADDNWLAVVAPHIDRIEVGDHGAKGLMSSRTVMQKEAMETITRQVLTPAFFLEMEAWGMKVEADLHFDEGFPVLRFCVSYSGEIIGSAGVDGYSGRIISNGSYTDELYMMPKQLQKIMSDHVERVMESLTA